MKNSFNLEKNRKIIEKASGFIGGGKSGQFFFLTHDHSFILKTISSEEVETLMKILPDYCKLFFVLFIFDLSIIKNLNIILKENI